MTRVLRNASTTRRRTEPIRKTDELIYNGAFNGTKGEGKRIEAIQIKLSGNALKNYDVYYRVYAQGYGWLGWAKNGASAGTSGMCKRLEAIRIKPGGGSVSL